ncbi:hypothetical protein BLS_006282 [Venturia inaequalis]|uniref:Uncharacterized protein n=1 Tax=Venturia inaequalis TaxID=5025 RepID=A0A8H3UP84_VENIN|nr:hypothetical protein BLS_006282 [Venturia inaequalis]KAE9972768.1 hypothetical protein EG328_004815 [Venturia inaequalis]RDI89995.1 hypothetical protein Vi05172_g110 [Venturia inaequalis]
MLFNAAKLALFAFVGLTIAAPAPLPISEEVAVAALTDAIAAAAAAPDAVAPDAKADAPAAPVAVKAVNNAENGPYGYGGGYNPGPAYGLQFGNPSPYGIQVGYQPVGYGGPRGYKKE